MTYTVTTVGSPVEYERIYTFGNRGDKFIIFTGKVGRLTSARKIAMVRAVIERFGIVRENMSDYALLRMFESNPFRRYDNVTITHQIISWDGGQSAELDIRHDLGNFMAEPALGQFVTIA